MKKILIYFVILNFCAVNSKAQSSYFPPLLGNTWDTISPLSLGWCPDKIDSLENYLAQKNTKAFIVLKQGKIALEKYFGTFTQDSLWYWASASKSLTGFLTGIAQEENLLSIEDTVSRFLGTGWTVCPPQKERLIKIKHQLSMTSGLDDGVPDDFCIVDTCLTYLADAGTRWAYHNAPYHLLEDVIANASGNSYNAFTTSRIKSKIGMQGLWYDYIFYSRLRDMARFGLLIQNKGIWNADTLLHDTSYFQSMLNSSQNLNLAYGYLWWLNGKSSFMLPQSQFVFQSTLIPNAPADAVAALGKNDQKIYVVPSLDLVVVRMGNSSGIPVYALSNFDNEVWAKLNDVFCGSTVSIEKNNLQTSINIFPNPAQDEVQVFFSTQYAKEIPCKLFNSMGTMVREVKLTENGQKLWIADLPDGIYVIKIADLSQKIIIQR